MSFLRDNRTLVLVCLVVALAATTVRAQQRILWQGAVKPEHINVYTSASASESVVRTLGRGQVVNVVLEVRVRGDAWCRVGFPGEADAIGYVLCMNLRQGNFTAQQATRSEYDKQQSRASTTGTAAGGTEPSSNPNVLTNKDILDMSEAGLPSEVLLAKIKSSQCDFDTSPARLSNSSRAESLMR